eukprot:CAMPEP_0174351244 /NCGR_PEP_ID=MMETSP0811_2-20130205/8547_1 /TAXON_ID=73025 ORGANISM="Eutreptiella gymnastica-like, Strain CCMP1594" /NCGR_SAMPLE_ID=MMETSP0811_2 /ASSEMBLY_ACC=CAM_ASM_000667 /LENGTH=62 /DNA_ID=CAMNT_0015480273 /DNA_START=86 /DNA_END=271 /DNA_ORIENTATION=+
MAARRSGSLKSAPRLGTVTCCSSLPTARPFGCAGFGWFPGFRRPPDKGTVEGEQPSDGRERT